MKKIFLGAGICMILLVVVGVFAAAESSGKADEESETGLDEKTAKAVEDQVEKVADENAKATEDYVKTFVEKKGIAPEAIKGISAVDFNNLPKEVNIENVDDTNLAIYQIDYADLKAEQDKQVYVITYSVDKLRAQGDLIVSQDKRQLLSFGFDGEMESSGFLKTDTDVETSLEKGYVMMRSGSITAISTNLEVLSGEGEIEIVIYKNGVPIGFGNSIISSHAGVQKDYDVQSREVVEFEPGDVISAYASAKGDVNWKDVITLVDITVK
jgi:hypothetical protein